MPTNSAASLRPFIPAPMLATSSDVRAGGRTVQPSFEVAVLFRMEGCVGSCRVVS